MSRKFSLLSIAAGWALILAFPVRAEFPLLSREATDLRSAARQLALQPPDPAATIQAAREKLLVSLRNLEQFLAGGGSQTAARWSDWLGVATIRQELARPNPDLEALRAIEERFYQNEIGLELPQFLQVRRQLHGYLTATQYAALDSPQELYGRQLAELEEYLARLAVAPNDDDAHRAARLLAWVQPLNDRGDALAREARREFCRINAVAQGSGRLANLLMERRVSERNDIAEMVMGAFTRGVAITNGQLQFGTVPNREQGTLEIRLQGRVLAPSTVAERGRIAVYSTSYTTINARKQVFVDDQGLKLAPASASAATSLNIQDIEARSRLVERLAWRRASRMVPEAEGLTSQRARTEAASKLDQQANSALGNMHDTFCQKIRAPLIRFDGLPAVMRFWTDSSHLRLALSQHNELQLAAATPPPPLSPSYDVAGTVHESMFNNLCESLLGGRAVKDQAWLDMMHLILGNPPRPLWVHDRAERWSVTFDKDRPVIARFEDNRIGVTLRLMGVTRGEREYRQPAEIQVTLVPHITRDGPALIREGDVVVRVSDDGVSDGKLLENFLHRKFGAVFLPEVYFYGLMPPTGGSLAKLRRLHTAEFNASRGWLTVAYELAE
jgi:hypothetical protein